MPTRRSRGELEGGVQRILWDATGAMSAREIVSAFSEEENVPSMTTVLTILDRLVKKGRVRRIAGAAGYLFEPTASDSEHAAGTMAAALLASRDRASALSHFAGSLSDDDVALLRRVLADGD